MKPIKFDLIVDRAQCHNLKTLQDNFNIIDVVGHFESGKLEKWLTVRHIAELEAVQAIDKSQDKIAVAKALCAIFYINVNEDDLIDDMMALDCYQQKKTDFETIKALFEQYAASRKPLVNEIQVDQFIVRDDGTALDTATGLTWCRYAIGQQWHNGDVVGDAEKMPWDEAMKCAYSFNQNDMCGGFTDWRLPTIDELNIIAEREKSPAINQRVFPKTISGWFWFSSPYADDGDIAWIVGFNDGNDGYGDFDYGAVRLVRSGQ